MITVTLRKFKQFNLQINNLTWKYLMKPSVLLNFAKRDIPWLSNGLQLPHKTVCCERIVGSNIEKLCILLKELSYHCRLS